MIFSLASTVHFSWSGDRGEGFPPDLSIGGGAVGVHASGLGERARSFCFGASTV